MARLLPGSPPGGSALPQRGDLLICAEDMRHESGEPPSREPVGFNRASESGSRPPRYRRRIDGVILHVDMGTTARPDSTSPALPLTSNADRLLGLGRQCSRPAACEQQQPGRDPHGAEY